MTRRWLLAFVLVALPWGGSAAAAPPADSFAEVHEVLAQCQAAYYRLVDYRGTLRHEVREGGAVLRQDSIDVVFRKPGFLSLRWQTGLYKGTALLARPAWNQGNLLITLGGWFDFVTLSVPPTEVGEPFVPGLKDVSEWLTALLALAQRPASDRSLRLVELQTRDPNLAEGQVLLLVPAFLIPFRDNTVTTYEFVIERGTGVPLAVVLRGSAGEVRQRLTYTDLQINVDVPLAAYQVCRSTPEHVRCSSGLPAFSCTKRSVSKRESCFPHIRRPRQERSRNAYASRSTSHRTSGSTTSGKASWAVRSSARPRNSWTR